MKKDSKLSERRPLNLPGVENRLVDYPNLQFVREGIDFGFFTEAWKAIKKLFHKQQGAL